MSDQGGSLSTLLPTWKTGTLTENQMTAVEGWFCGKLVRGADLKVAETFSQTTLEMVSQNIAINRACQVRFTDDEVGCFSGL